MYSTLFQSEILTASFYHLLLEGFLLVGIIWLFFRKSYRLSETHKLTEKEKEELIAEWQPEPLVPDTDPNHYALHPHYIEGRAGKYVSVDGKQCLNLATLNFLGLIGDKRIEESAKKAVFKYGVGSCGPRAFYGTVDVHLELEKQLADFLHCESGCLYSYGFAAIASAIPAYAKRGDVIFVDKGVNFAIQKGILASRSRVEWFEHNDVADLERLLRIQAEKDIQNPKKAKVTRRFMVVEGLYHNSGDICPLPELLELKWKYKVRIFIDESLSLGTLGKTGRGVLERFDVDPTDIDLIMGSLENAIGSTGGFVCGRQYVTDHQLLSGSGYCFSASLPPLLAVAAIESLRIISSEPDRVEKLREKSGRVHSGLRKALRGTGLRVRTPPGSPMIHVVYSGGPGVTREAKEKLLDSVVQKAMEKELALTRARYLEHEEVFTPEPSIRISVNQELTNEEIDWALETIKNIARSIGTEKVQ